MNGWMNNFDLMLDKLVRFAFIFQFTPFIHPTTLMLLLPFFCVRSSRLPFHIAAIVFFLSNIASIL